MACDCGAAPGSKKHLPGCSSQDSAPPKKRRLPRGAKCPVCQAVMHMNSKGQMECAFTSSHPDIVRMRNRKADADSAAKRGQPRDTSAAQAQKRVNLAARQKEREAAEKARKDEEKRRKREGR